ncbi:flavin-containing monooxygenase, putative [Talaromyces stipitatus ATCC 10500]|uniref:Flavin-containing monooxygenase, putative n=1 Tax=Talaromyces stipitatus (strain ATCC 10500 / CBS 375.48 / QM 6759 / NRRL 1006) TaxID=441959 RepID=B8LYP8_TALSN|nr:flavin-containing monooxygenase, putative [Talaromyces stipitatus ATCC 10500]EED23406.1 flavin-containing monooxygenase, putative [Talaromyces stipitatus ATCC 10500]
MDSSRNYQKTVLDNLPCSLPTRDIPEDIDPCSISQVFSTRLAHLSDNEFTQDAIWRDMFSLSGTLRSFYSAKVILPTWRLLCQRRKTTAFKLRLETAFVNRKGADVAWIEVSFNFTIGLPLAASCSGYLCLVPNREGEWKIWVMGTILDQLPAEYGDIDQLDPVESSGSDLHINDTARNNPVKVIGKSRPTHQQTLQQHFDCIIVGAGQSGLCTAGRLQALGVSYICIDSNNEVGDSWRLRYDSSKIHTTRESSHLPFETTFTSDYPEWLTKDDLADAFKIWGDRYGITSHIWLSTTLESGSWDESTKRYTLKLRKRQPGSGQSDLVTVTSSHVVMAIGINSQVPKFPDYANKSEFQGTVMHSRDYKNSLNWKGKHGVVVGTANTGHDIAEDMVKAGLASVTIVQRSKTYVIPQTEYQKWAKTQYNLETDMKSSDIKCFAYPNVLSRKLGLLRNRSLYATRPNLYFELKRAGFLLEQDDDLTRHLCERLGGHYMDIGASKKIADGLIKIKAGSPPVSYTPTGLLFADGTHLKADVLVFATGFLGNMRDIVRRIFVDEVADRAGDCWGVDDEGEIKGVFKPTGQPGLWYIGGAISHARFFSRFIAMQIKAALEGKSFPVFDANEQEVSSRL